MPALTMEALLACQPERYLERAASLRRLAGELGRVEGSLSSSPSGWRGRAQRAAEGRHGQLRDAVRTAGRLAESAASVLTWYGEEMRALQARARQAAAAATAATAATAAAERAAAPATTATGAAPAPSPAEAAAAAQAVAQARAQAQAAANEQQRILAEAGEVDGHTASRLGYLGAGHLTKQLGQVPGMPALAPRPVASGGRPWHAGAPHPAGWQSTPTHDHPAGRPTGQIGTAWRNPTPRPDTPAWQDHTPTHGHTPTPTWQTHPTAHDTPTPGGHNPLPGWRGHDPTPSHTTSPGWHDHPATKDTGPGWHGHGPTPGHTTSPGWHDEPTKDTGPGWHGHDPTPGHTTSPGWHDHGPAGGHSTSPGHDQPTRSTGHDWQDHKPAPGHGTSPVPDQPTRSTGHDWQDHKPAPGHGTSPVSDQPTTGTGHEWQSHGPTPGHATSPGWQDQPATKDGGHGWQDHGSTPGQVTSPGSDQPTKGPSHDWQDRGPAPSPSTSPGWQDQVTSPVQNAPAAGPSHDWQSHSLTPGQSAPPAPGSSGGGWLDRLVGTLGGGNDPVATGQVHAGMPGGHPDLATPDLGNPVHVGDLMLDHSTATLHSGPSTPDSPIGTVHTGQIPTPVGQPEQISTGSATAVGGLLGLAGVAGAGTAAAGALAGGPATPVAPMAGGPQPPTPAGQPAPNAPTPASTPTAASQTTTARPAGTPPPASAPASAAPARPGPAAPEPPAPTTTRTTAPSGAGTVSTEPIPAKPGVVGQAATSNPSGGTPTIGHTAGSTDQWVVPPADVPTRPNQRTAPEADPAERATLAARYEALNGTEPVPRAASPAELAALWSRGEDYPGEDRWQLAELPAGTLIAAPGQLFPDGRETGGAGAGFVIPAGQYGSAADLYESLQVAPQRVEGRWQYASTLSTYRIVEPLSVATSTPTANPHWGSGGGAQLFVPDMRDLLFTGRIEYVSTSVLPDPAARLDADHVRATLRGDTGDTKPEPYGPPQDRTPVEPDPAHLTIPVAHLLPILAALVEAGARIRYQTALFGFHPARDGWRCELLTPLDTSTVDARFALPDTIHLDHPSSRLDDTRNHARITAPAGCPGPSPR